MVDFPQESKGIWFPNYNWEYRFVHFNALWRDNSISNGGRDLLQLNEYLWDKTQWYD